MWKIKKISFRLKTPCFIFTVFLLFFIIEPVHSSLKYYYIHVGSFQAAKKATQFARNLQKKGLESIVRGEEIANRGFWYRVYVGPFYSRLEAELESRELKKNGIIDYAAIQKKDVILTSNLEEKPDLIDKGAKAIPEKEVIKISPPQEKATPVSKVPSEPPPIVKKPPITEPQPSKIPVAKERIAIEKTPPPSKAKAAKAKAVKKVHTKTPLKFLRRGYGRNHRQGGLSLCIKHIYRDIKTEVTERKTFGGLPQAFDKYGFPTSMHITNLRLHLGLTDYFEIFADVGSSFHELSDLGFVYGGGVRLNLFESRGHVLRGFYAALQGEYLDGEFKEEYESDVGNIWKKETDWQEFAGRVELGITRSKFTAYIGGIYFHYTEDAERQQLSTLIMHQDDLEEKNEFGAFAGIDIHLTTALIVNLEGQVFSQKGILLGLEYLF